MCRCKACNEDLLLRLWIGFCKGRSVSGKALVGSVFYRNEIGDLGIRFIDSVQGIFYVIIKTTFPGPKYAHSAGFADYSLVRC